MRPSADLCAHVMLRGGKMAELFKYPIVQLISLPMNAELENSTHHHMRETAPGAKIKKDEINVISFPLYSCDC